MRPGPVPPTVSDSARPSVLGITRAALVTLLILAVSSTHARSDPTDDYWADGFCLADIDGRVDAMVVHDGGLVVLGRFDHAGPTEARNIARWDGSEWHNLGSGVGGYLGSAVASMVVHNGDLIVAGNRQDFGGWPGAVARWNGTAWSPMSDGNERFFEDMVVHEGRVVGACVSTMIGETHVQALAWDGESWSAIGDGVPIPPGPWQFLAGRLVLHQGDLVIGASAGDWRGVTTRIARWNGSSWVPFGTVQSALGTLISHNDTLYASYFDFGSGSFDLTAKWTGSEWETVSDQAVTSAFSFQGDLYGWQSPHVVRLHQNEWTPVGAGFSYLGTSVRVSSFAEFEGHLCAAGEFRRVGDRYARAMARWTGTTWEAPLGPPCQGVDGTIRALAEYGGALYAGGKFVAAGGQPAKHLARWDGIGWTSIDAAFVPDPGPYSGAIPVRALTVHDQKLIVGGDFHEVGGIPAMRVASFDGSSWQALGEGISGTIYALASHEGSLFAAGSFDGTFNSVAQWDGLRWLPLAAGVEGVVYDLAWFEGDLIAAGSFVQPTVDAYSIARWDGTRWDSVGTRFTDQYDEMRCVSVYDDRLIIGGLNRFGNPYSRMAVLEDDGSWQPITSPTGPLAFAIYDNRLVTGSHAWDGMRWAALGSGAVGGNVYAMAIFQGDLYVGGGFRLAGAKPAYGFSRWSYKDETPPLLALHVLHNPYLTELIDVYVMANEALKTGTTILTVGTETVPLRLLDPVAPLWRGDARLSRSGEVTITMCGDDVSGNQACISTSVVVARVSAAAGGVISTPDGRATVHLTPGALTRDTVVMAAAADIFVDEPPRGSIPVVASAPGSESSYVFSPGVAIRANGALVEILYRESDLDGAEPGRIHIFQHGVGSLASIVDTRRRLVSARASELGRFGLALAGTSSSELADASFLRVGRIFPNPIIGSGTITFDVRAAQRASVKVYDVGGRLVARLLDGRVLPGTTELRWDGHRDNGQPAASGVYFYVVQTEQRRMERKITLIR